MTMRTMPLVKKMKVMKQIITMFLEVLLIASNGSVQH